MTGEKKTAFFSVRCGPALLRWLDERQRERERASRAPLSRAIMVRLLLEELSGVREDDSDTSTIPGDHKDHAKASSAR